MSCSSFGAERCFLGITSRDRCTDPAWVLLVRGIRAKINGLVMELLEGHTWQDPSATSASSLLVMLLFLPPATPMVIPVMDTYKGKMLIVRKPKELSRR